MTTTKEDSIETFEEVPGLTEEELDQMNAGHYGPVSNDKKGAEKHLTFKLADIYVTS